MGVEAGVQWCAPEVGIDWDALEPGNWLDRGLGESLETPTPEELDDWFGRRRRRFGAVGCHGPDQRLAVLEATLGTADEAWAGVNRVRAAPTARRDRGGRAVVGAGSARAGPGRAVARPVGRGDDRGGAVVPLGPRGAAGGGQGVRRLRGDHRRGRSGPSVGRFAGRPARRGDRIRHPARDRTLLLRRHRRRTGYLVHRGAAADRRGLLRRRRSAGRGHAGGRSGRHAPVEGAGAGAGPGRLLGAWTIGRSSTRCWTGAGI